MDGVAVGEGGLKLLAKIGHGLPIVLANLGPGAWGASGVGHLPKRTMVRNPRGWRSDGEWRERLGRDKLGRTVTEWTSAQFRCPDFRGLESRCHALPDPRVHSKEDWAVVFARMERNMERMKVPPPTGQQTEETLYYLQNVTGRGKPPPGR